MLGRDASDAPARVENKKGDDLPGRSTFMDLDIRILNKTSTDKNFDSPTCKQSKSVKWDANYTLSH